MGNGINAIDGDKVKINTFKVNGKDVALDSKYISNTRLLSIFDVDNTKGYISTKELEGVAALQENYFVELYDDQGHKIREVEDVDGSNFIVKDYETRQVLNKETNKYESKDVRVRAGYYNIDNGNENYSLFTFNKYGEETGMNNFENKTPQMNVNIEYAEDGVTPKQISQTFYEYNPDGTLKNTKEEVTTIEYDDKGNVIGIRLSDKK